MALTNHTDRAATRVVDHSLHGLVNIRLVDPPASAIRELEHRLGPSDGGPAGQPDICFTFVREAGHHGNLRFIGLNESAFDDRFFYLLDHLGRRARFDCARLGEPLEIVCESSASVFPLLPQIIALRLLAKGYMVLHAAAMVYEGKGVLVTGWQKGGKTETLLSFMSQGARFLADEWTIISPADGTMWGVPGALAIWDWHLRSLPHYRSQVTTSSRLRLGALRLYQNLYRGLLRPSSGDNWLWQRLSRLSLDGGSPVGVAHVRPALLFGDRLWSGAASIDVVVMAEVGNGLVVSPIDPAEIARRMVASLAYERRSLRDRYEQFRFAFPDRRCELLEAARDLEHRHLERAIAGRPAYRLTHPYPVPLQELWRQCLSHLPLSQAPLRACDEFDLRARVSLDLGRPEAQRRIAGRSQEEIQRLRAKVDGCGGTSRPRVELSTRSEQSEGLTGK